MKKLKLDYTYCRPKSNSLKCENCGRNLKHYKYSSLSDIEKRRLSQVAEEPSKCLIWREL